MTDINDKIQIGIDKRIFDLQLEVDNAKAFLEINHHIYNVFKVVSEGKIIKANQNDIRRL